MKTFALEDFFTSHIAFHAISTSYAALRPFFCSTDALDSDSKLFVFLFSLASSFAKSPDSVTPLSGLNHTSWLHPAGWSNTRNQYVNGSLPFQTAQHACHLSPFLLFLFVFLFGQFEVIPIGILAMCHNQFGQWPLNQLRPCAKPLDFIGYVDPVYSPIP